MTAPFDEQGLWLKSRLFINRALDDARDFDERAFWACQALELLGKSALARLSPLLIANPMDDGSSLLAASGVAGSSFASVQAKAVWARCARAFKPFSADDAKKLSRGRNDYIHSAAIGFDAVPERAWWPTFWSQVVILLPHLDQDLSSYVPRRYVDEVNQHLNTNRMNLARRLEAELEHARQRLAHYEADMLSVRALAEWKAFGLPYFRNSVEYECPACHSAAQIGGENRLSADVDYSYGDDDWGEPIVKLEVATDWLACSICHLTLEDYDLLVEAGIPLTFFAEGDSGDIEYEPEYNNE